MALLLLAASAGNVAFPEAVSDTSLAALRTRQLANIVRPLAAFKGLVGDFEEQPPSALSMLDVGTGDGWVASQFASRVGINTARGYDVSPPEANTQSVSCSMTKGASAHELDWQVPVELFDGRSLPEPDASWDVVSAFFRHPPLAPCGVGVVVDGHAAHKYVLVQIQDWLRVCGAGALEGDGASVGRRVVSHTRATI